jgi:hypothetical protein
MRACARRSWSGRRAKLSPLTFGEPRFSPGPSVRAQYPDWFSESKMSDDPFSSPRRAVIIFGIACLIVAVLAISMVYMDAHNFGMGRH